MARKRASLKGKGAAILLGEEGTEESPPPNTEVEMPPEAGEGAPSEEVDWSAMLKDEAATAEPPTAETGLPSLPEIEHFYAEEESLAPELTIAEPSVVAEPGPSSAGGVAPPTPVLEEEPEEVDWTAMLEDEVSTAESGEATVPSSVPPIEYHYPEEEPIVLEPEWPVIDETAILEEEPPTVSEAPAAPEPALPAPSSAADQPPPSAPAEPPRMRIGGLLAGVSLEDLGEVGPPGSAEVTIRETDRPPARELTDEEEERVIKRVSRRNRRELYDRISELYHEVSQKLASSGLRARREEALLLLSEARDIVLEDPRQFDVAEHKVWQVEAIISSAKDVEKWSHYYGNRLIVYLTTWFVLLMAGIVFFIAFAPEDKAPWITVTPLLFTMLWGGIGGVVGGIYSLWRHIADFDKQYTIWYTLQPISGIVMGGLIHVFVMTGFLSMSAATGEAVAQQRQAVQWFPALLAVIAGFRQNFVYALIDRVIELIFHPSGDEGGETQAEEG